MWGVVGGMVDKAMKYAKGEINTDQVKAFLVNGTYELMVFTEDNKIIGAVVFQLSHYPNDTIFYVVALGGKTTQECASQMFEYAKARGCTTCRGSAHESVARLWRMKYGFECIYYIMEKRL